MKKKNVVITITLVTIILALVLYTVLSKQPIIPKQTLEFMNGLLQKTMNKNKVNSLNRKHSVPYPLTEKQNYGTPLMTENSTHILVIGSDASGSNYDTMLIAGLDAETGELKLVNIPRDLYIEYSETVLTKLKAKSPKTFNSTPARKINAAHIIGKHIEYNKDNLRFDHSELDFTADVVQEILGIRIDDVMMIKPSSFRKVVDYFGGVDLEVPYLMKYSDSQQNLTINLKKGFQHLNGSQAEGFVRFRQGVNEIGKKVSIGDIERKKNQNTFVKAFAKQHFTMTNLGKMVSIAKDLDEYMNTSIDSPERIGAYAKLGLTMLKEDFHQTSEDLSCTNFKKNSIYFLRFMTLEEREKAKEKK